MCQNKLGRENITLQKHIEPVQPLRNYNYFTFTIIGIGGYPYYTLLYLYYLYTPQREVQCYPTIEFYVPNQTPKTSQFKPSQFLVFQFLAKASTQHISFYNEFLTSKSTFFYHCRHYSINFSSLLQSQRLCFSLILSPVESVKKKSKKTFLESLHRLLTQSQSKFPITRSVHCQFNLFTVA